MCCGQKRAAIAKTDAITQAPRTVAMPAVPGPAPVQPSTHPCFEYLGKTALIVIGPSTRTRYHFTEPGQRLPIDPRDRSSLVLIRQLAQVPGC
jgi:hypothetical protein